MSEEDRMQKVRERKAVDRLLAYYFEAKHLDKPLVLWSKSKNPDDGFHAFMITEEQFAELQERLSNE